MLKMREGRLVGHRELERHFGSEELIGSPPHLTKANLYIEGLK